MIECFLFVFLTLGLNAASLIAGGASHRERREFFKNFL